MPDLQDQLAISALMQDWALARDTGDWGKLRATAHPGAAMTTTWFDGRFEDFVASCQTSFGKGSRSQHFLGGTVAEIKGARAIAQTRIAMTGVAPTPRRVPEAEAMLTGTALDNGADDAVIAAVRAEVAKWTGLLRKAGIEPD